MLSKKNKREKIKKILSILQRYKLVVLAFFVFGLLSDIFLSATGSDIKYFGILGIGIIGIFLYRLSSKFFFSLALITLLIMFLFFVTSGASVKTEKTAVWFFLLFATGIIRQWKE